MMITKLGGLFEIPPAGCIPRTHKILEVVHSGQTTKLKDKK
jgi:hypothetical protein